MDEQHPDPFAEAASSVGQTFTQAASLAATGGQIIADIRAGRRAAQAAMDEKLDRWYRLQEQLQLAADRKVWGQALDRGWLADAGIPEVAQAWSAAVPYGDSVAHAAANAGNAEREATRAQYGPDPDLYERLQRDAGLAREAANYAKDAAAATEACEARLRQLHPHAMEYYDRFRANGMTRPEAMYASGSYFKRDPNLFRRALGPARVVPAGLPTEYGLPSREEWELWKTEVRVRAGLWRLDDRALRFGRDLLDSDGLRTAIDATITPMKLSTAEIDRIVEGWVRDRGTDQGYANAKHAVAETAERERASHLGRAAGDPTTWAGRDARYAAAARAAGYADALYAQACEAYARTGPDYPYRIWRTVRLVATYDPQQTSADRSETVIHGTVVRDKASPPPRSRHSSERRPRSVIRGTVVRDKPAPPLGPGR